MSKEAESLISALEVAENGQQEALALRHFVFALELQAARMKEFITVRDLWTDYLVAYATAQEEGE